MPNNREKKEQNSAARERRATKQPRKAKSRQAIIRKRKMLLVAAVVVVAIIIAAIVCLVTGVFEKKATVSTVTVKDNGTIVSEEITALDQDYYNASDLKDYAKSTIKAYNKKAGEQAVKYKKLSVKDEEAYMKTTYKSEKDYAGFTGYEMFTGTLVEAQAAGYDFSNAFVSVKKGAKGDTATAEDILANEEYKIVIIKQNVTVKVPGTIQYVSDECTTVNDSSSVTIAQTDGNEDATVLTYIIYK